jgi:hypothetical protein
LKVPRGGLIFPSFDLNHSYTDCDVFVSLAKLKEHMSTGLTLTMKNCFGITPCTIYGDSAGEREPSPLPIGGRVNVMHHGKRQPSASAASERDPSTPREGGYRVPRIVTDLVAARPVDLAILDAIETMTGGEGPYPWTEPVAPGLLIAGTNCVATDAIAAAAIGFDPMAARGTEPFLDCDNTIALGEAAGAGPRDFNGIDVTGWKPGEVPFDFRPLRRRWREKQTQRESARGSRPSPCRKETYES